MKKSNKLVAVVLALVMMITAIPMMTAGAAKHEHLYEQQSATKATCTTDGKVVFKCDCGDEKTVVTKATGHDPVTGTLTKKDNDVHNVYCKVCKKVVEVKHEWADVETGTYAAEADKPTCTKAGKKTVKCTANCGATTKIEVPANGHNYKDGTVEKTSSSKHKGYCEDCKAEKSESHVWEDVEITTPAGCYKSGVKTVACEVCDAVDEDVKVPAAHKFGDWELSEDGKEHVRKCQATGCKKVDDGAHNFVCKVKEGDEPTCKAEGVLTITCFIDEDEDGDTECAYEKEEKIALGEHQFTKYEQDYTALKHKGLNCKVCGESEAAKHEFVEDTSKTKAATCAAEGEKTLKCVCGKTKTETIKKLDHKWSDWKVTKEATATAEGSKERECSVCKTKETEAIAKLGGLAGDVNGDGKVSAVDARLVLQHVANTANPALTAEQIAAADIVGDKDGVKASDARKILEIVAGKA